MSLFQSDSVTVIPLVVAVPDLPVSSVIGVSAVVVMIQPASISLVAVVIIIFASCVFPVSIGLVIDYSTSEAPVFVSLP